MNPLIHFKTTIRALPVAFVLTCLAPAPMAQAVVPAPDGGYPGFNTAEGTSALQNLSTGIGNTAAGWRSLLANTAGNLNTATGAGALLLNTGDNNTATGALALFSNTTGTNNTAVGSGALASNNNLDNTAMGYQALSSELGSFNTAIGYSALANHTVGTNNTALGFQAGIGVMSASNVICIGSAGADVNDTTWIGNVYGVTTQNGTAAPVIVSADGQLGTVASSQRFKKDIAAMDKASEAILSLRPVTFHYRRDTKGTAQFGLIAEEVAKVNPALVLPDKEGKPYTVRYDAVNAMLLNEFLKEHRTVQEQKATIAELRQNFAQQQKQIEALTAGLQKVSAQLELNKPAPQTAQNND